MTRINCIPAEELHDKHLLAEYRELPRVLTLAVKASYKNKGMLWSQIPSYYVLGKGHVKFFYNKLYWLEKRYRDLLDELERRRVNINPEVFDSVLESFADVSENSYLGGQFYMYYNDWTPTEAAMELNRQRINERLKEMGK